MSELELEFYKCPKCKRNLKPSIEPGILHITEYPSKVVKKIDLHDLLVCRYCKISVKTSVLRKQKDPIKFLEQFAKIPEHTEIKEEEREKIRLREEERENLKKYKYDVHPEKCIECESEDIVADCGNNSWICLSCDAYFELREYRIMFHGDIEVVARNHTEAIEKGYELLRKGNVDIEADYM